MQPDELFAHLAAAVLARLADERPRPLAAVVEELSLLLGQLHVAALQLPAVAPSGPRPTTRAPAEPALPDLARLDAYYRVFDPSVDEPPVRCSLADDLRGVHEALHRGLQLWSSHPQHAVALWREGYARGWGERVVDALPPLHRALAALRDEEAKPVGGLPVADLVLLREVPSSRPFLGVRFAAVPGGVEVLEVHPEGPTAGLLQEGDYLLEVDGAPLADLSEAEAAALLVGPIGEARRVTLFRAGETIAVTVASAAMPEARLP